MATKTETRLSLKFEDSAGKAISMSYNPAKKTASEDVKALMDAIITHGNIFTSVPATAISAQWVTTKTEDIDLS